MQTTEVISAGMADLESFAQAHSAASTKGAGSLVQVDGLSDIDVNRIQLIADRLNCDFEIVRACKRVFESIDVQRTGYVDKEEFFFLIDSVLTPETKIPKAKLIQLFTTYGDGKDSVSLEQWTLCAIKHGYDGTYQSS